MGRYSRSFKALWSGEVISEFAGASGAIVNGLLLFELTGSREWMGAMWLLYFVPSLLLQGASAPFLNYVAKEVILRHVQLIRACAYILPLAGLLWEANLAIIVGLISLQLTLGLLAPIYASLSFAILPEICADEELVDANGLLDGTLRLMGFLAPSITAGFVAFLPLPTMYIVSASLFLISFFVLSAVKLPATSKKIAVWTKRFWFNELKTGFRVFLTIPILVRLSFLSATVQFAVGATMVVSIPFIRTELGGAQWEYALFSAAFPLGYVLGTVLLRVVVKREWLMYTGLIGGGFSFVLLFFVQSTEVAWLCELFGGIAFPFFNAQSAAIFQRLAPKERLAQLSAVRLLFLRASMPLGIVFATLSAPFLSIRAVYVCVGLLIIVPGLVYLHRVLKKPVTT
ncbi:hypothetical protein JCM19046_4188 [Bacillus sp. JCM 19046]|nr:hypothetical protein JCM19046_4188 [Bacillus sp. JCM 19046]